MIKSITYIMLFVLISCKLPSQTIDQDVSNENHLEYIIIVNVGMSNYSVAPLVISKDSIDNIPYKKGSYDLHAKYYGFKNIVIGKDYYDKLFNYLNSSKECDPRTPETITKDKNTLIFDYRKMGALEDCKLLSVNTLSATLFTLKNLYCYMDNNKFKEDLLEHVKMLHRFYLDTYDREREFYKSKIDCGN